MVAVRRPGTSADSPSRAAARVASAARNGGAMANSAAGRGGRGRRCIAFPSFVRRGPSVAPSHSSNDSAAASCASSGRSNQGKVAGSPPHARMARHAPDRSPRRTSGTSKAASVLCVIADQSRTHLPAATRPARPARCSAEARLMRSVVNVSTPRVASNPARRTRPLSSTTRTRGNVSDVSAMLVAQNHTRPWGVITDGVVLFFLRQRTVERETIIVCGST